MGVTSTTLTLILISLVVGLAAALQSSIGYGLSLIANPILVLINPDFVPGPVLFAVFFLSILVVLRERSSVDLNGLSWALVGRVIGAAIAAWLLLRITQNTMILMFGFMVLFAVLISATGWRVPMTRLNLSLAGVMAGIMGTIASIGGPPIAMVYQYEPGDRIRSTLSGFFIFGTVISIVTLASVGRFGWEEIRLGLELLPGILIGFLLSTSILPHLKNRYIRPLILTVATVSAVVVILRQVL
jgi:uncharacterized membrane protein YfcA